MFDDIALGYDQVRVGSKLADGWTEDTDVTDNPK